MGLPMATPKTIRNFMGFSMINLPFLATIILNIPGQIIIFH